MRESLSVYYRGLTPQDKGAEGTAKRAEKTGGRMADEDERVCV